MSINALKDLNSRPASESKNDDSSGGCYTKPCNGNMNENVEEKQSKKSSPIHVNGGETVNSGVEVANSEVEYFESENLSDLEDIDTNIFTAFNDHVVDLLDPLLVQLLLKSSQYKKFVCEAADRALEAMTTWVSPIVFVPQLGVEGITIYGIDRLIQQQYTSIQSWTLGITFVNKNSPLSAQAVLRVTDTNVVREGRVVSS
ncbi:hypothetical protein SLE2022_280140 [Rubroshorea leprosula]